MYPILQGGGEVSYRGPSRDGSDLLLITLTLIPRTRKGADVDERLCCDATTFRHQRQKGFGEGGKLD